MSGVGESGCRGFEHCVALCVAGGYDAFSEDCPLLCVTQQFSFLSSCRPDLLPPPPDVSVDSYGRLVARILCCSPKQKKKKKKKEKKRKEKRLTSASVTVFPLSVYILYIVLYN